MRWSGKDLSTHIKCIKQMKDMRWVPASHLLLHAHFHAVPSASLANSRPLLCSGIKRTVGCVLSMTGNQVDSTAHVSCAVFIQTAEQHMQQPEITSLLLCCMTNNIHQLSQIVSFACSCLSSYSHAKNTLWRRPACSMPRNSQYSSCLTSWAMS